MDPQSQDTPLDETSSSSQTESPRNTLYIEILLESCIVVVIIAVLIGVFSYFKVISLSSLFTSKNQIKTTSVVVPTGRSSITPSTSPIPSIAPVNILPIQPSQTGVGSMLIYYTVISPISEIKTIGKTKKIIFTNFVGREFILPDDTKVFFSNQPSTVVGVTKLQKGDNVSATLLYTYRTNKLEITRIDILSRTN